MAELIAVIRRSRVPVLCLCNERQSQKVRSLANHCFDLRFQRPRMEQIRVCRIDCPFSLHVALYEVPFQGRILSIACKEGIRLSTSEADRLIVSANQDVRQAIHALQLVAADVTAPGEKSTSAGKDVTLVWRLIISPKLTYMFLNQLDGALTELALLW